MNSTVASNATAAPLRLVTLARDIKLSHSIFALPFALLATYLAGGARGTGGELPRWSELLCIVLCMVFARTVAMTVNRLADRRLDALNPRTKGRALPGGALSTRYVVVMTVVAAAGFVASTAGFLVAGPERNAWPVMLSPLVLAWLCLYSFTKRFTWLCHLFLGSALALSPVAAAIAIWPAYLASPAVWLLAVMVMCWVAGFDVIYSLQDVAVDRSLGLHSMPSRLGEARALWISRGLHVGAAAALIAMHVSEPQTGVLFAVGIGIVIALLLLEHWLVWRSAEHHLNMAFFTVNGVISLLLGVLGIVDVVMG